MRDQGRALSPTWNFQGRRTSQPRCGLRPPPRPRRTMMRFYNQVHRFYCGVDLHARSLAVCILDQAGAVVFADNLAADPATFLNAIASFRDGLVVACECMFAWY